METNDVEALGSRAPDATVILLITESLQITKLWTADSSHFKGGLCMRGYLYMSETLIMDNKTD